MKIKKSRNNLKYSYSLEKKFNFQNNNDNFNTTIHKIKNPIISSEIKKSSNFYDKRNNKNNYTKKGKLIQFTEHKEKELLKSDNNIDKYISFYKNRNIPQISRGIAQLKKGVFNNIRVNNNNKKTKELKYDEDNKVYVLPDHLRVKNFSLKTSKILDYLNLNKDNKCFLVEKENVSKHNKLIKNCKFNGVRKMDKNMSFTNVNNRKKLENIYTFEGIKFRIPLEEPVKERKKKKEMPNNIFLRNNFNLKKKMIQEKNKTIDEIYKNKSRIDYKRELALSSMKIFKKGLDHLKRKISFKFNINLPLYNLFLNFD